MTPGERSPEDGEPRERGEPTAGAAVRGENRGRAETEKDRLDRNLSELLEELRVAMPGVQVLFAFLLALPLQQRFTDISGFERDVYFATLMCAATATVFLVAPAAHHRIEFRQGQKLHIVKMANVLALVGLGFLALAVTGAVLFITSFVFSGTTAAIAAAWVAGLFVVVWYVIPLARRLRRAGERG